MAFLSSRIQETEAKFLSAAKARVECGGLTDIETEVVLIGGQVGMQFQTGGGCGLGWSQVVCDTNRPAFLERDLVGLMAGCIIGYFNHYIMTVNFYRH